MGVQWIQPSRFAVVGGSFDPLSLSPRHWIDASDTSSITSSGGAVSQWNDKSGNGKHLTQGTGSLQPTTGANTINGLNVITYDATRYVGATSVTMGTTLSIFLVVKVDSGNGSNAQFINYYGSNPCLYLSSGNWAAYGQSSGITSGTTADTTVAHVLSAEFNGASSTLRLDGSQIATGTLDNMGGSGVGTLDVTGHSGQGAICKIGELLIYPLLSSTNRNAVEAYLRSKWNTP